jgi:hypothetical protein
MRLGPGGLPLCALFRHRAVPGTPSGIPCVEPHLRGVPRHLQILRLALLPQSRTPLMQAACVLNDDMHPPAQRDSTKGLLFAESQSCVPTRGADVHTRLSPLACPSHAPVQAAAHASRAGAEVLQQLRGPCPVVKQPVGTCTRPLARVWIHTSRDCSRLSRPSTTW